MLTNRIELVSDEHKCTYCNYCQVNYEFVSRYSPRILPQWMLRGPKNGAGLLIK